MLAGVGTVCSNLVGDNVNSNFFMAKQKRTERQEVWSYVVDEECVPCDGFN